MEIPMPHPSYPIQRLPLENDTVTRTYILVNNRWINFYTTKKGRPLWQLLGRTSWQVLTSQLRKVGPPDVTIEVGFDHAKVATTITIGWQDDRSAQEIWDLVDSEIKYVLIRHAIDLDAPAIRNDRLRNYLLGSRKKVNAFGALIGR